jgi:hypothetical protein
MIKIFKEGGGIIYTYKSKDTLCHLSLHDCVINHVEWQDDSLVFFMEWIEVLETHPQNNTGRAKTAKDAIIKFEKAREISCLHYDYSNAIKKGIRSLSEQDAEIMHSTTVDRCVQAEISNDDEFIGNERRIWRCECQNDSEFWLEFSSVWICFDSLSEDSWFVSFNQKK